MKRSHRALDETLERALRAAALTAACAESVSENAADAAREVVGFTIVDFVSHFSKNALPLAIPLNTTFERASKTRKTRVIAERIATYKVRRKKSGSKKRTA